MIGKLNHVAIAVPDLTVAAARYTAMGASVSATVDLPEHGVQVIFVELTNTHLELLAPLGENSPVAAFLERYPEGGMHHICLEVEDIHTAIEQAGAEGTRVLGNGQPRVGAHEKPVVFLHPKDMNGVLVELQQA
ncbi:MAG TPA: methylmalonyl-CoA epimerase [Gammaproteobacteria bacterium]|nr:methylmalonyl-CoA epimerase [Gammaproteobacteria bacterium]